MLASRRRRRDPVRDPGRQGRAGLGRLRRRGRRADGGAGAEGGPPRARRDHRRLPLRVHLARPLRRRPRRRGRQRHHLELLAKTGDLPRRGRRGRRRALGHDGRPGRRDPLPARRGGPPATCRSSPTAPSTRRRSTARSARRPSRRPSSATAAATRWTRPTPREAVREAQLDLEEGADVVMVKPALPYLDVIRARQGGDRRRRWRPTTSRASTRC